MTPEVAYFAVYYAICRKLWPEEDETFNIMMLTCIWYAVAIAASWFK